MITIVTWLLILTAILLSPFYGLWIFGGWICDRREMRRRT